MAVQKDKICKECKLMTTEEVCPNCNSKNFVDKHKGKVIMFNNNESIIATKAKTTGNGKFALKI